MHDMLTLHIFARTAELHSFSKAAASLGIKNSTVSRHIRQLEQQLGIALFNRSTRALALTEGGRTLWQQLAPALQAIEQACLNTAALNQQPQGRLRLAAPAGYAHHRLLPRLPAFLAAYPQISIEALIEDAPIRLIDQEIDLAIWLGNPQDSSLQGRRLESLQEWLVAAPDWLQRQGPLRHPAELEGHACLGAGLQGPLGWYFQPPGSAGEPQLQRVHGRFRSNDSHALLQMALAGQGLALLPAWQVATACQTGQLQRVLADWTLRTEREPGWVWALYPPKLTVSSKVRAFIDFYAGPLNKDELTLPADTEN